MKKVLATILAFVYLFSSMGATIHMHYCMGKLASWGLIDHERTTCASCGMVVKKSGLQTASSKMNCCKDEHKLVKTGTDQKLSPEEFSDFRSFSPDVAINEPPTQTVKAISFPIAYPKTNSPPFSEQLSRIILYCNFRI